MNELRVDSDEDGIFLPYGEETDQNLEVMKFVDEMGNFVHHGRRSFHLNKKEGTGVTGYLSGTSVSRNEAGRMFAKIPNLHRVRQIVGLSIGVSDHYLCRFNENPDDEIGKLRTIPSTAYLFQNVTTRRKSPPFVQFEFVDNSDIFKTLRNRYIGSQNINTFKYCEIKIYRGCCCIGLSPKNYFSTGIGWRNPSIGYHADNGMVYGLLGHNSSYSFYKFHEDIEKEALRSSVISQIRKFSYGKGCVVGMGVDFNSKKIFFTKNGIIHPHQAKIIDSSNNEKPTKLYPSVGCFPPLSKDKMNCFEINLGEDTLKNPFMFEEMNVKEDLLYLEDKNERISFLFDRFTNFEVRMGLLFLDQKKIEFSSCVSIIKFLLFLN